MVRRSSPSLISAPELRAVAAGLVLVIATACSPQAAPRSNAAEPAGERSSNIAPEAPANEAPPEHDQWTETDDSLTASEIAEAFEQSRSASVLRARSVRNLAGPGLGFEVVERDLVGYLDGDSIAHHSRRSRPVEVDRRLPAVTDVMPTRVVDPSQYVVNMEFVVVDDCFWVKAPELGFAQNRWTAFAAGNESDIATNPYHYLDVIERALQQDLQPTLESPTGARRVDVEFYAAELGALVGGERNPNFLNAARDGIVFDDTLRGSIEISADGYVTFVEIDVADWYEHLLTNMADDIATIVNFDEVESAYTVAFARLTGGLRTEPPSLDEGAPPCPES